LCIGSDAYALLTALRLPAQASNSRQALGGHYNTHQPEAREAEGASRMSWNS